MRRLRRKRLGHKTRSKQAEVLRRPKQFTVLNCSRQWGKSTLAAIRAVHRAYMYPGSLIVVASRGETQAAECVLKAREFVQTLEIKIKTDGVRRCSILLPNGSRIVGLPGAEKQNRGLSAASLLVIDEAAVVPDDLYYALRPMLSTTNGDLMLMSTPRGKHGFFYQAWAHAGPDWQKVMVPATQCGRISKEWLQSEREALGDERFRREYECEFTDDDEGIFRSQDLEAARTNDIKPLWEMGT